jgi:pheromone shutdown protein TraB
MSAAIQAADTDRVVGIDGPSIGFLRRLAAELYRQRASPSTLRTTAGALCSVTATALRSRLAGTVAAHTSVHPAVELPTAYDTDRSDDAETQAADEQERMRTAASMLRAFQPPPATAIHRAARERYMADRLSSLDSDGPVVAVLGKAHLDAVAERLERLVEGT